MKRILCAIAALSAAATACEDDDTAPPVSDRTVAVTEIVSDQPGAQVTDPTLVNAWGLAFNPAGFAWVTATEAGSTKVYDASGNEALPEVTVPSPQVGQPSAPTGQVFNDDTGAFQGDQFILVTEDGIVSGWQETMGGRALKRADNSEAAANYKGVAIANDAGGQPRLFAADFHGAKIDAFDASYSPVTLEFRDPDIPAGFAPFNVEEVNGALLVSYAKQDEEMADDVKGAGNGYVDLFDTEGALLTRLITQGELDSPWGMVLTPDDFAAAPGRLLVGNFGDGRIHVYTFDMSTPQAATATLEGTLHDSSGNELAIDGLWALEFPPDAGGFDSSQLYYTAGPAEETHGVFGRIDAAALTGGTPPTPSPTTPLPTTPYAAH